MCVGIGKAGPELHSSPKAPQILSHILLPCGAVWLFPETGPLLGPDALELIT